MGICAGFKIKINGCIPDYEDNCYRMDFSGVTIPCLVPMANLHPLSVSAAILIFFPTLQFLMTKVVLDVESRRDRVGLKIIRHFISNKTQKRP